MADPTSPRANGHEEARVVEVTPDQARRAFWREVDNAGIARDYFEELLAEHGHDGARHWLEDHNFWGVRAAFGNAYFLTNGALLDATCGTGEQG